MTWSFFRSHKHSRTFGRAAIILAILIYISAASSCRKREVGSEIRDAVRSGDSAKFMALLKQNPNLVFSKDDKGWTPLHYAAYRGYKGIAELLLDNKANVDAKTATGETPLHNASAQGHRDAAELLVDGGEKLGHFGGMEIGHGVGYASAISKPEKRPGRPAAIYFESFFAASASAAC